MTAFETAQLAAQVLDTKKGEQVRIRDVSVLGDYCDCDRNKRYARLGACR